MNLFGLGHRLPQIEMRLTHEVFLDALCQKGQKAIVIAVSIDQDDRPEKLAQALECHHLEELLEGAAAAGQRDHGFRSLEHSGLAGMHVRHDVQPGDALMPLFYFCEKPRNDPVASTARGQGSVGHCAHQPATATAEIDADPGLSQGRTQARCGVLILVRHGLAGSGINCYMLNSHTQTAEEGFQVQTTNCKHHRVTRLARVCAVVLVAALVSACGAEPESAVDLAPGQGEYLRWCASCHGNAGEGKAPAFPPLAGSEWLDFPDRGLAMIILYGLRGEIEVAGRTYRGYMPPMTHLADEDIESILSYVTRAWAGRENQLTASDIAALRLADDTRPLNARAGLEARLQSQP